MNQRFRPGFGSDMRDFKPSSLWECRLQKQLIHGRDVPGEVLKQLMPCRIVQNKDSDNKIAEETRG